MPDYALINQCLYEGKAKDVKQMTQAALDEGRDVFEILNAGLIDSMSIVGEDFKHNVLYVPQVLIAARAMKAGLALLKPLLEARSEEIESPGTVIMGTVQGDLHDIGKNLVCMMAEGAGFTIVDLGTDTSLDKFEEAVREHKADVVGMSALLTTTMRYMKTVVEGLEERGLGDVATIIGGAPVSQMYADEIGADGYGVDAPSAVDRFLQLVEARRAK